MISYSIRKERLSHETDLLAKAKNRWTFSIFHNQRFRLVNSVPDELGALKSGHVACLCNQHYESLISQKGIFVTAELVIRVFRTEHTECAENTEGS